MTRRGGKHSQKQQFRKIPSGMQAEFEAIVSLILDGVMTDTRELPHEMQEAFEEEGYLPHMPPPRSQVLPK